jgi:hypothetical protein
MARGVYTCNTAGQAISTAITILEITAPSTAALEVIEAYASSDANTDVMARIQLLRKSATITGTASPPTPNPYGADGASGVTVKWKATAEGTDGVVIRPDTFHMKSGWFWVPKSIRSRLIVPPSGMIALKFPSATNITGNWTFGIDWEELG